MPDPQKTREQAEHLAAIVIEAQKILEAYVAEKVTLEEAMTALTKLLDAPELAEWLVANGFVSKQ